MQKGRFDDFRWLQRFPPRRPKSIWSRFAREKSDEFAKSGRVKPPALAAMKEAKSRPLERRVGFTENGNRVPPRS